MVTEDEWSGEVAKSARFRLISPIIALGAFALIFVPCMMAGQALASGSPANNPRVPTSEEIIALYKRVYE